MMTSGQSKDETHGNRLPSFPDMVVLWQCHRTPLCACRSQGKMTLLLAESAKTYLKKETMGKHQSAVIHLISQMCT